MMPQLGMGMPLPAYLAGGFQAANQAPPVHHQPAALSPMPPGPAEAAITEALEEVEEEEEEEGSSSAEAEEEGDEGTS